MNFFLIIALMRCNSLLICDIQFYPSESQHFPILHLKNAIAITLNIAIYRDQGGTLKEIAQRKHQQAQNNYGLSKSRTAFSTILLIYMITKCHHLKRMMHK